MSTKTVLLYILFIFSTTFHTIAQVSVTDSLELLLQEHKSIDTLKVNLLNKIAIIYLRDYKYDKGLKYAHEAQKLSIELNFAKGEAESLYCLGDYYRLSRNYPKAIEEFKKSLELKEALEDRYGTAKTLNRIGTIYINLGDYSNAIEFLQKSFTIMEELDDKEGLAINLNYFGIVYTQLGNYLLALEYHQKSLKLKEEMGDKKSLSNSLNNIGILYDKLGEYSKALEFYQKSLELKEALNDKKGISTSLNNIGIIYNNRGEYAKAFECFQKGLEIEEVIDDKQAIASSMNNLGLIYSKQGDYLMALNYHQKAVKLYEDIGCKIGVCYTYYCMGDTYQKLNKYTLALNNALRSLKIAEELSLLKDMNDIHSLLAEIYAAKKDYKNAYTSQLLHKKLNDSIFNENNIKEIMGLELKYKYEKEKELLNLEQQKKDVVIAKELKYQKTLRNIFIIGLIIAALVIFIIVRMFRVKAKINSLLKLKNNEIYTQKTFISNQNTRLQFQAAELSEHKEHLEEIVIQRTRELIKAKERAEESDQLKTAFLNNISHEFRTPMNGIIGFSALLARPNLAKEELEKYSEYINDGCKQLLNIVNDTVEISKVHSNQVEMIVMHVDIFDFITLIINDFKKRSDEKNIEIILDMNLELEHSIVQIDANKLKRIFEHLIDNAIKFTNQGYIKISGYWLVKNQIQFQIEDTGIGIPVDMHEKIFDPFRQADHSSTRRFGGNGIGLSLVKAYVELIGGKVWLKSEPNNGTTFFFTIPIEWNDMEEKN